MALSKMKIIPTCRYEHGPLARVIADVASKDPRFGWVAAGNVTQQFVGILFTCGVCGYTELFDDEPAVTAIDNRENLL